MFEGNCAFTWPGETYSTNAGWPLMATCTPSSEVGALSPLKSAVAQDRVVEARFRPVDFDPTPRRCGGKGAEVSRADHAADGGLRQGKHVRAPWAVFSPAAPTTAVSPLTDTELPKYVVGRAIGSSQFLCLTHAPPLSANKYAAPW